MAEHDPAEREPVEVPEAVADRDEIGGTISRELLRIHEESYGVGARRVRTFVHDELIITMLDIELSMAEHTLLRSGHAEAVKQTRQAFQQAIGPTFKAVVERATGRRVLAFLSDVNIDPLFTVELFRLAPSDGA